MKKFSILITAAMVLIFIMPAFAGKPTSENNQTEIINTSENPVPITTNDQIEVIVVDEPATARDVNITNPNPIPVSIIDECTQKTVISVNIEFESNNPAGDYIIMTVPPDKKFILTDIVSAFNGLSQPRFFIKEDSDWKIYINVDSSYTDSSTHLISGIPFSPGSDVVISKLGVNTTGPWYFTITGYLLDI